jgi:hypothetical protein
MTPQEVLQRAAARINEREDIGADCPHSFVECAHDVCEHGSFRIDCWFCRPPLTADELSELDLRMALRVLVTVVAGSPDRERMQAVIAERIRMHPDPYVVALKEMLESA